MERLSESMAMQVRRVANCQALKRYMVGRFKSDAFSSQSSAVSAAHSPPYNTQRTRSVSMYFLVEERRRGMLSVVGDYHMMFMTRENGTELYDTYEQAEEAAKEQVEDSCSMQVIHICRIDGTCRTAEITKNKIECTKTED